MGRFLDARTSENSSTFGAPGTALPIAPATPALVGEIGLQTQGVAGTGTNGLIVHLGGTVGVTASGAITFILNVQRGSTIFGAGTIIYTAEYTLLPEPLVSFYAEDLTAPAAAETIYALFLSGDTTDPEVVATRVGPESFFGFAADGLAPTP